MVLARKRHKCFKCKGLIPEGTNYVWWEGKRHHMDCAPREALKDVIAHYPTSRRIMKKLLKTGSVKGFYK